MEDGLKRMLVETVNQSQHLLEPPKRNKLERKSRDLSEFIEFSFKKGSPIADPQGCSLNSIIIPGSAHPERTTNYELRQ